MSLRAFGPGKVILLGEHAVVYGHPALAGSISRGVTAHGAPARECGLALPAGLPVAVRRQLRAAFKVAAELTGRPAVRVTLERDLPTSMGLGSSAALSVATARLLLQAAGRRARPAEVAHVALGMEREFHGTPSGVDHTCSALGTLIEYRRRPGAEAGRARVVECPRPLHVVVALVGERSPTRSTVAALRARRERWPARYGRLFAEVGRVVHEGVAAVEQGDLEALGDVMNVNQGLLSALGLSSPGIDAMVHRLRQEGALGAKLTGAGGDGGAVVGLFERPERGVRRLTADGITCFTSQLAGPLER
ncbi:MAG: mevalonate kinase [Myxococcaceae bacterium]|nr:mevalonate kinase [Myxococcaceae bacterium]MCI0669293.1 mevalonate kinase [Myxococcaceae bacterium]